MTASGVNDPLVGTMIGPCRVEMRLAAGGMGVVYRAHHSPTDQAVALKILAPSLAQDQEYVTRFFREAGAAGQIDHPNVVRVIDVGKHEEKYYIVMEFVAGDTLDRVIEQERRLQLERATRITREMASGLAAAHRAGIIHRDVKPGNIIVSRDGRPHLTDFGLARTVGTTKKGLTIEGTFLGTPEFASPEQVEGRKLDQRTDLYSLGVTYYQLLSGTLPFLGDSPMEIAIKRTKEPARPLNNAYPGADPRACAIVDRLLQQEPSQRYGSMMELIRDLDAILSGKEAAAPQGKTATGQVRMPRSAPSRRGMRMLGHWALTGVSIVLAFLSGALAARPGLGGSWTDSDKDLMLRLILAGAALLCAGGAVFLHRKELGSVGRTLAVAVLALLMAGGALGAGAWIDREGGAVMSETVANSFAALGAHADAPVNLLAMAIAGFFVAALLSYEQSPGGGRIWCARLLLLGTMFCAFAFGCFGRPLGGPFGAFLKQAELSVPLITAVGLAGAFGMILLTGYEFGSRSRAFGMALSAAAAVGLFVFSGLVGQPESNQGWMSLLGEPFADVGRAFPQSGTALAAVFVLGAVQRVVIAGGGVRRVDRLTRKR